MRSFPERVYAIVLEVPRGSVITYGAIARLLGDPRKAREVGWAMAATPERQPSIPAHRVIMASGALPGGHAAHRAPLEAEGVRFLDDGRVDVDRHLWMPADAETAKRELDGPRTSAKYRSGRRHPAPLQPDSRC